jgi:hypothetical protein
MLEARGTTTLDAPPLIFAGTAIKLEAGGTTPELDVDTLRPAALPLNPCLLLLRLEQLEEQH